MGHRVAGLEGTPEGKQRCREIPGLWCEAPKTQRGNRVDLGTMEGIARRVETQLATQRLSYRKEGKGKGQRGRGWKEPTFEPLVPNDTAAIGNALGWYLGSPAIPDHHVLGNDAG
jgi:hypothetical protein